MPSPGELRGALPVREDLPLERAARQRAARGPDPGELPGAPPVRDDLPLESAARSYLTAAVDQHARRPEPFPSAERPLSPSGTILPDPPGPGPRRELAAKLSLAELARVRQALALLSEDSVTAAERTTGSADGPVPSSGTAGQQAGADAAEGDDEDEADTLPMPVVLRGDTAMESAAAAETPLRDPFEPARPSQQSSDPEPEPTEEPGPAGPAESLPPAAAAKLDQIKDLLITAEAIGEYNLDQHFEQVRQQQQKLIREFFNEAVPGRNAPA